MDYSSRLSRMSDNGIINTFSTKVELSNPGGVFLDYKKKALVSVQREYKR